MSGQHRHRWLHALLYAAILISFIIPAGIQANPDSIPQEAVQLPVSLQRWSHIETLPLSDDLRAFKRGMEYYLNERYAAALEQLPDEQAAKAIAIGDYMLFYRAKSNLMLEREKDALNYFQLLESRYPASPLSREALVSQCQILLAMGEAKAALAVLDNPKVGTNSETQYYRARALDLAGEKEKAVELYLQVYSRYPASKFSPLAEQSLVSLSPGALKGARNYDARLQRAESLISEGTTQAARTLLLTLGKVSAPNSRSSEKRSLLFGDVEYHLGRTLAAIPYFHKVTSADPALHVQALYFEGLCLRKLEKEEAFLALRDKALKLYPRSPEAEELCYSAATYFDVKYEKSRDAYALLYDAFPQGKYAERALWKLALSPYFEKKYEEAALGFWKYLRAYPSSVSAPAAMYWMGRCYQKLGDSENAKYLFMRARALASESFYGERSREAEISLKMEPRAAAGGDRPFSAGRGSVKEIDFNQVIAICDGIELQPITMAEPDSAAAQVIERARQLMAAGLTDLALTELRWGTRQYPQDNDSLCYIMARIYASKQDYDSAIACLHKAFPDYNARSFASLPIEIWDILFPIRHWEAISEQAAKVKIDSNLVLAVIRQESAFNEKAHSKANARGLMQILPSTGWKLAKQARSARYNAKKLYQAETNLALGIRYLASLLQEYGRPELALAAYNAGDTRVDRWLKEWGNLDMAEFIEQIPFSETRGYVRQVLNNRVRYGLLTVVPNVREPLRKKMNKPTISKKAELFTESVIREMTRLAQIHGAVNLAQGMPDFEAPSEIKEAACRAIMADINQYAITWGAKVFRDAISAKAKSFMGLEIDPEREVTVTCGSTEAMIASLLAIVNPGDEVIIFEPYYENYGPDTILSGAIPRFVKLHPPDWHFDPEELQTAFNSQTRAIIINTPNNPTGKVFSRQELENNRRLMPEMGRGGHNG